MKAATVTGRHYLATAERHRLAASAARRAGDTTTEHREHSMARRFRRNARLVEEAAATRAAEAAMREALT
jgi:hypothetical protein